MAYTFSNDNTPANGTVAMWTFLSTLLTAGWTRVNTSDGTTKASGQVTGSGSGTNGLANASAWVCLQHPTLTGFQILVQHSSSAGTHNNWAIAISRAAGFTGGSATVAPTATDVQQLIGSTVTPTFSAFFGTDAAYRTEICAGGSTELYSFCMFSFPTGNAGGTYTGVWALDMMATGSFQASDTAPWVMYFSASTSSPFSVTDLSAAASIAKGYLNLSGTLTWVSIAAATYIVNSSSVNLYPATTSGNGAGVNSFNSKDNGVPILWARDASQTAPFGHKGYGTMFRWASKFRTNMDTVDTVGTKDRVWVNGNLIPWGSSTPTI